MNEKLMPSVEQQQKVKTWDPLDNPPSLQQAQIHRQATKMGINSTSINSQFCACCGNVANKEAIKILCQQNQLFSYGLGYPLYFYILKAIMIMMSGLFILEMIIGSDLIFAPMIIGFSIYFGVSFLKPVIQKQIKCLSHKMICPSIFTIMLKNISSLPSEQQKLNQWIEFIFGQKPVNISKVSNSSKLQNAYQKLQDLNLECNEVRESMNCSSINESQRGYLQKRWQQIKLNMSQYEDTIKKYQQVDSHQSVIADIAFVTFSKASTVRHILKSFQYQQYIMTFKYKFIKVCKAPSPKEIIWRNIRKEDQSWTIYSVIVLLVLIIFEMLIFAYVFNERQLFVQFFSTGIKLPIFVLIINFSLQIIIKTYQRAKKYFTFTERESSFYTLSSTIEVLNYCILVFLVKRSYNKANSQLRSDIRSILIINAFFEPVSKILNPLLWIKVLRRCYYSQQKLNKSSYTQNYFNRLWEDHETNLGDNYNYLTKVLFVTIWFANAYPFGIPISLFGLAIDYLVTKVFMSKYYKTPSYISEHIALPLLKSLEIMPFIYLCGFMVFICSAFVDAEEGNQLVPVFKLFFCFISIILQVIMMFVGKFYFQKVDKCEDERRHEDLKWKFDCNYETANPVSRLRGEFNFLQDALRSINNKQLHSAISSLLTKCQKDPRSLLRQNVSEFVRLKWAVSKVRIEEGQNNFQLRKVHNAEDY